jgi:hypothetical protein
MKSIVPMKKAGQRLSKDMQMRMSAGQKSGQKIIKRHVNEDECRGQKRMQHQFSEQSP